MKDIESGITLHCYMNSITVIKLNQIAEHKQDDYHIYFICSTPKSYFVENSISFTASKISCELVHEGENIKIENCFWEIFDGGVISGTSFKLSNDRSTVTLSYFKNFVKQKDIVLSANEAYGKSGLMTVKREKILYIGQSFGNDGERTAAERLGSHSTLQAILSDIQSAGGDEEVQLYLLNFKMDHILQLSGSTPIGDSYEKATKFINTMNDYNQKMCINLVEASLINYFKPEYNIQYKNEIFDSRSPKFKIFYQNYISKISVQICPTEYYDEALRRKNFRMPQIIFYTDEAEYDTGKLDTFISSDLDRKLYSTFAKLKKY